MPSRRAAADQRFSKGLENDRRVCRSAEPRICRDLRLELTRAPARVAECDDGSCGPLAASHGREDVLGDGDLDRGRCIHGRIEFSVRFVQHEAAIGVDGAAAQDRLAVLCARAHLERELAEDLGDSHRRRPVDDDAQRPLLIVLADIGDGLVKVRVAHAGHSDEEVAL